VPAALVGHLHLHAVFQQPVDIAIGVDSDLLGSPRGTAGRGRRSLLFAARMSVAMRISRRPRDW
jgi:hypothetical protein